MDPRCVSIKERPFSTQCTQADTNSIALLRNPPRANESSFASILVRASSAASILPVHVRQRSNCYHIILGKSCALGDRQASDAGFLLFFFRYNKKTPNMVQGLLFRDFFSWIRLDVAIHDFVGLV